MPAEEMTLDELYMVVEEVLGREEGDADGAPGSARGSACSTSTGR